MRSLSLGELATDYGSPAAVVTGVLLVGYLPPPGMCNGKISEIRYPYVSEYLRASVG